MSVPEILARTENIFWQSLWALPNRRPKPDRHLLVAPPHVARISLARPPDGRNAQSAEAVEAIAAAERLLRGEWRIFEVDHPDFGADPDWFVDPLSHTHTPDTGYGFSIPYRDEAVVGNIKYVWEASRHQATTLLAAAWWLTGDDRFAERAAAHLESWWHHNQFMEGIHWTSPFEASQRLMGWTWARALLSDWAGCRKLFDANDTFTHQLYFHQSFVARFYSRGSSRNNHVMAELAGIGVSAAAFPWFDKSEAWAGWAYRRLAEEAELQTAADGLNREHAADYHRLVLELLVASTMAAELAERPLPQTVYEIGAKMADGLTAILDDRGQPPRYGDADDGHPLLVDSPEANPYASVLGAAGALFGAPNWWPEETQAQSVLCMIARGLRGQVPIRQSTPSRPTHFAESGQSFLRTDWAGASIWLRCDHAPLGYRTIAAHGHADALSFELRIDGTEIFIDPGTYCYHGETAWRHYFRGSLGHNTWVVDGADQASLGGPFLWLTENRPTLESMSENGVRWIWQARHEGYRRLRDPVTHHRRIEFDYTSGIVEFTDWLDAKQAHEITMPLHLGATVQATLNDHNLDLNWADPSWDAHMSSAQLQLSERFSWEAHRGQTSPPLGWVSHRFGQREPTTVLIGRATVEPDTKIVTRILLHAKPGSLQ